MYLHALLSLTLLVEPPTSEPSEPLCRGTVCASGVCAPPGTPCPSAAEIAAAERPPAPAMTEEQLALAREEAEMKRTARADRREREVQVNDDAFERVAGLTFTILAANSRVRVARRRGAVAFGPGGVGFRF